MSPEPPDPHGGPGEVLASTGGRVDLDRIIGRIPVVLVFLEPPGDEASRQALQGMGSHLVDFGRDRVQLLAVAKRTQADVEALESEVPGNVRILADPAGALADRYGGAYVEGQPTTVLIDVRGNVTAVWHDEPGPDLAVDLLRRIDAYEE
ncbi:peroxiredoxin family protein [Dermatobacter hominis]|uniref:peroxiredoxin family protein n=1 Tax=Dermatobacter hominis TaxID=2884263 RepID=UPI001D104206|nr:redoxin domain-containing protein [Dermatobacter hominis]UDY35288.1 redoxin domain-containing protein [Dermatobacter hominis]